MCIPQMFWLPPKPKHFGILALSRIIPCNLRLAYIYVSDKPRRSQRCRSYISQRGEREGRRSIFLTEREAIHFSLLLLLLLLLRRIHDQISISSKTFICQWEWRPLRTCGTSPRGVEVRSWNKECSDGCFPCIPFSLQLFNGVTHKDLNRRDN